MLGGILNLNRKISIALVVLIAIVATGYVAWAEMFPSGTWRYKMTVTVDTPEGIKTGSAVREIKLKRNIAKYLNPDIKGSTDKVFGESVVVDLGERGVIFALINWNSYEEFYYAFPGNFNALSERINYYDDLPIGSFALLPEKKYPKFVIFSDRADPKSVKVLPCKDFASTLGQGVKLKNISIEKTSETVTRKSRQFLPSFGPETGFIEWLRLLPYADERRVSAANF